MTNQDNSDLVVREIGRRPAVIRTKIEIPCAVVAARRVRVERAVQELVRTYRVAQVVATAGSGKTTAVADAMRHSHENVAWLSVDGTDVVPGRLVTYLEAAVEAALPGAVPGVARAALAAGIPHAEAAGLLVSSLEQNLVVVIDQLERLRNLPEPWAVIEAFVRYAPPRVRFVLVSRRDIPSALCALPVPGVGSLPPGVLLFTEAEAAESLTLLGVGGTDAGAAVAATGGWVTGVLFEAWRSDEHVPGFGGEADPLHGYLSAQILGDLTDADRDFLVCTAVLDEVTVAAAEDLGIHGAAARLASLYAHRLPADWGDFGSSMRCHPRFREYLLTLFHRLPPADVRDLRHRYALVLAREGRDEEATEALLEIGDAAAALAPASRVIREVIARRDHTVADRWLRALDPVATTQDPYALCLAHLHLAVSAGDFPRGHRYAQELASRGMLDTVVRDIDGTFDLLMICCTSMLDAPLLRRVLAAAEYGPDRTVAGTVAALYIDDLPNVAREPVSAETEGAESAPMAVMARYLQGRVADARATSAQVWSEWIAATPRALACRALGRTADALEIQQSAIDWRVDSIELFEIRPDLLLDAGLREQAIEALEEHRLRVRRAGSTVHRLSCLILNARMALRLDRDAVRAMSYLDEFDRQVPPDAGGILRAGAAVWRGLSLLILGRHEEAASVLRTSVAELRSHATVLDLAHAAVFLSEAEWRCGNDDAADRAAAAALDAARVQGASFLLLEALQFLPAVASRQIDAERSPDGRWHHVGRQLNSRDGARGVPAAPAVRVREFGRLGVEVDGVEVPTGIRKSAELLAFVSSRGGRARREVVLTELFKGSSAKSAAAYLRQARSKLNRIRPGGVLIEQVGEDLVVPDVAGVITESAELEYRLREAGSVLGRSRLAAITEAIEAVPSQPYLPDVGSDWVEERRDHLMRIVHDACLEAAELAFDGEDYSRAAALAQRVVDHDPYREAAWRMLMSVSGMMGDDDGVVAAFQRCRDSLAALGTEPSESTRDLLTRLRR